MTEFDLNRLSRRTPPAADPSARAAALAAAMQAFDGAEKTSDAPQGSAAGGRRSSIFNRIWSPIMNRRFLAGSALATLLVVPAAGLITYELVKSGTVTLDAQTTIAAKPADEEQRARRQVPEKAKAEMKVAADSAEPAPLAESREEEAVAAMPEPLAVGGAATVQSLSRMAMQPSDAMPLPAENRERFASADPNPVKSVATDPVSTFSADVDTASYSYVRRSLLSGSLPNPDSVRVE